MNEGKGIGKKIILLLISISILLIVLAPISASELDDGTMDDYDDVLEICTDDSSSINDELIEDENEDLKSNSNLDNTPKNILTEQDPQNTLSNSYTLREDTYSQYFDNNGNILENTLKSGDTLILENLTKKKLIITLPLNLIGSNDHLLSNSSITVERGGANTNITGLKIIDKNGYNPIYLRNTENVTIKDCHITTTNFAIPIVDSNYNQIINNVIDNDLSNGHSAIVLGNSHYNNISYNYVKNGANCIYLCSYMFLDHNGGGSNNNIITYNTITGEITSICYGIVISGINNTVMYNNVENTGLGIITSGKNNTIYFNNVTNSGDGISISSNDKTLNNTVDGVLINGNQYHEENDITEKETIYVDGKLGNDNNYGTETNPFKTIKAAANYINSKEKGLYKIIVSEGTYNENNITINNSVNLIGNGNVTIDGESKNNIILLKSSNLYIESINFINGQAKENSNGGAIYSQGNLTLQNCRFTNNKAKDGGAIYGTYVTIKNSTFTNNNATNEGIIYIMERLDIHNSTFFNNKANGKESTIITLYYNERQRIFAKINISNCNFTKNQAKGIVMVLQDNITDCSFNNNTGISILMFFGNVNNCKFNDNDGSSIDALSANITNCEFNNNTASGEAELGQIHLDSKGKITNCTFSNNKGEYASAIWSEGKIEVINSKFYNNSGETTIVSTNAKIQNSIFINNTGSSGGAAYILEDLIVDNSTFINNSAAEMGGAIYCNFAYKGKTTINNSTFINNSAKYGGAVAIYSGKISKTIFEGNDAQNGKDMLIMKYFQTFNRITGWGYGIEEGIINITDDNYWGNISSQETFFDEKRIVNAICTEADTRDENNNIIWFLTIYNETNLAPAGWLTSIDDGEGGIGDGTGTGIGNGTGDGIGNGDGDGNGNGTGDGEGNGNGNGTGTGDGTGTGIGNGNGTGTSDGTSNGTGMSDILSDLKNNITNALSNNENITSNIKTNKSSNPKTEIETDAGTYSTDPSESKDSSDNSEGSSSPGESGGHLKSYELNEVKKIKITEDTLWLSILLLTFFLSLFLFGFLKERRDEEKREKR